MKMRNYSLSSMAYNPKFGPYAQTPEQRTFVLQQMQDAVFSLQRKLSPACVALYNRYVSGELSWTEMRQALDLVSS